MFLSVSAASRSAFALLILSGLVAACDSAETSDPAVPNAETNSPAPVAEKPKSEKKPTNPVPADPNFPEYSDTKNAFTDVARRILGMERGSKDGAIVRPGMVHLAEQLGYGWTRNTCAPEWDITSGGAGGAGGAPDADADAGAQAAPRAGAINLTSNHQTGTGYGCDEGPSLDDPAAYSFFDWVLADSKAVKLPWTEADLPGHGGPQATVNEDGEIETVEPIVVETDSGLNPSAKDMKLTLGVDQAISVARMVTRGWTNSYEGGITVGATFDTGKLLPGTSVSTTFSFKYTRTDSESETEEKRTMITPKCGFEVTVPPGCHYTGKITVSKVRKEARYRVHVAAMPQSAAISGFMREEDSHGCMHRAFKDGGGKDVDGNCDSEHVDEVFGGAKTGMVFFEDIARQRKNDSGNWYWHLMASAPDYKNAAGKPIADEAIENLKKVENYQFALPFVTTFEDVTQCSLALEVAPDSTGQCTVPPPATAPAQ